MSNDVEMHDVTGHLLDNEQLKEKNDIKIPDVEIKSPKVSEEFTGLTKEELEKYAKDPFWRKLRLILFIIFWLVWLGMLVVAILIVVLSPKCPKRPKLEFWEKKTGYWVDTLGFADSDGNGVGDFNGLISKLDYIEKELGAGYIVLDPVFTGQYSGDTKMIGSVNSFRNIDSFAGNTESFKKLIKESRKRGIEIVMSADFNALTETSDMIQKHPNLVMKWNDKMNSWFSRDGKSSKKTFKNEDIYNSASEKSKLLELDLINEIIVKEIKESVKMWLDLGVRGFLLTNIAMYIENTDVPAIPTNQTFTNQWYTKRSMNGQLFSNDTNTLLKEIRSVMDEVAKKSDKSRLLIVDAGNVGFGLEQSNDPDVMLQYLDGPNKIADMIVGREFLGNRGWNVENAILSKSSVSNYLTMIQKQKRNRVALTSATSTSLRTKSLQKLAAPFLLPGNPILYYGSELGLSCDILNINSIKLPFYPQDHTFPLDGVTGELPMKCNHMIMPWDNSGKGFFTANNTISSPVHSYISAATNTVQGLTAIGIGETILQLHKKLIKLRENPSLQWGDITIFLDEKNGNSSYEIYVREADGFPKIIFAMIKDTIEGRVISFTSICKKVKPLLVYPANANLPENVVIDANNIYLKIDKNESLHVFECSA